MNNINEYFSFPILLAYCLISFVIGWRNTKNMSITLESYAVGYSSISTSVLVSGIIASALGAGGILGNMSSLSMLGLPLIAIQILKPLSWWISSKIFPRNLQALKGCLSISHVMNHLYGSKVRWVTTALTLLTDLGIISAQMIAVGYILNSFFALPVDVAAITSLVMIMSFSLLGGIRAITQTGVFQFSLFFILFPVSYVLISYQYGGSQGLSEHLPFANWGMDREETKTSYLLFLAAYALVPHCGSSFIQKCLIARNKNQLESSLKLVGMIYIPIMISLWFIAYAVKATAPELDPDQTLFYYISQMCPFWIKGLLSVSVIAIIMGMSDGILHADSVIIANDIVKVLRPQTSDKALIYCAKGAITALCFAAFFLMAASGDIIEMIWTMDSLWFPIILVPICAGFAGFTTDKRSFIYSTLIATTVIALGYFMELSSMAVFGLGILGSFIGLFGSNYLLKSEQKKALNCKAMATRFCINIKSKFMVLKARIARDLFPEEEKMLLGQKQIYPKFCVAMITLFFIYAVLMSKGEYYKIMGTLLSVGYGAAAVLMAKDIIVRNSKPSKLFYFLWYGLLIIWSTVSSYALIDGGVLMTSIAGLALLMLIVFTNAMTYLFSTVIGFSASALIYHCNIGEIDSYQFYLTGLTCMLVGYFFLRPQEEVVKDRVAEQQMMLGTMAHELTSPQAAAEMSLEMVSTIFNDGVRRNSKNGSTSITFDDDSLSMLETFMANALKSTKAGIKIVKMLLMVSKADKVELPKELFNMQVCAQKAIEDYIASNKSVASKISINIDKDWQVNGPKDFVEQVIHNLVKNSFVHGGKRPDLQVKVYNDNNKLIIEDNGMGIPAEYLPFIFERFFSKSSSGTGIGLALSKMVAESMGGSIVCESQIGGGSFTRFIITVPKA